MFLFGTQFLGFSMITPPAQSIAPRPTRPTGSEVEEGSNLYRRSNYYYLRAFLMLCRASKQAYQARTLIFMRVASSLTCYILHSLET
ncbi:hypothetical protein GGR56DRAFT_628543 [Xylariaceae sp. FL0804]|nr:hypothetical protein GGR56DRAFT_628543 [Xylariaceae sp. FL0804]